MRIFDNNKERHSAQRGLLYMPEQSLEVRVEEPGRSQRPHRQIHSSQEKLSGKTGIGRVDRWHSDNSGG